MELVENPKASIADFSKTSLENLWVLFYGAIKFCVLTTTCVWCHRVNLYGYRWSQAEKIANLTAIIEELQVFSFEWLSEKKGMKI